MSAGMDSSCLVVAMLRPFAPGLLLVNSSTWFLKNALDWTARPSENEDLLARLLPRRQREASAEHVDPDDLVPRPAGGLGQELPDADHAKIRRLVVCQGGQVCPRLADGTRIGGVPVARLGKMRLAWRLQSGWE
jgi:hypothetical protein